MNKKRTTYLAVATVAILSHLIIAYLFSAPVKKLETEVNTLSKKLQEEKLILKQKVSLESEWQSQKNELRPGLEPDAMLNSWVKDLLACAQSQSLVLEKLEPAGVKSEGGVKKGSVFVSFHGDIRSLARYVYELLDKDVFSSIDSFGMRREEDAQNYSFELMLGKVAR